MIGRTAQKEEARKAVLRALRGGPVPAYMLDTPGAARELPELIEGGFVERTADGQVTLTEHGRGPVL